MSGTTAELRTVRDFLRRLALFSDLPEDDISKLCRTAERRQVRAGELLIEEGSAGDELYIIISGELEITKREGKEDVVLAERGPGEVIGETAILGGEPRSASARTRSDSELLVIGAEQFREVIRTSPSAAVTMLKTMALRSRSTEASLMQREKLASLGTLAAGIAHELNNPAAAIQRSAEFLGETFENWRRLTARLNSLNLSDEQSRRVHELEGAVAGCGEPNSDQVSCSREESRLTDWLEELGVEEPWEVAPALASYGWTMERIVPLKDQFSDEQLALVLEWLSAGLSSQGLVQEIQRSAQAISSIVKAVKTYAYLDQAPVQEVDIPTSLEDTLVILRHKLKAGVEVQRRFAADLPRIEAYASELNQVWTNLIDNAIHAMDGKGVLELHAARVGDKVEVCIVDHGSGIPEELRSRIFDPFYTTKPPGEGSGLGLHIARNIIVNRHGGRIDVESQPGRTAFRIGLPLRLRK